MPRSSTRQHHPRRKLPGSIVAALAVALSVPAGAAPAIDPAPAVPGCQGELPADLPGRYAAGPLALVVVERRGDTLVLRPFHWGSPQILEVAGPGTYTARGRPERTVVFDCGGGPRVTLGGLGEEDGVYARVDEGRTTPLEDVVAGRVEEALRRLVPVPGGAARAAEMVLAAYPSAARHVAALLEAEARENRLDAAALPLLVEAYLLAGRPDAARAALALAPEPHGEAVRRARERLVEPDGDLGLAFPIGAAFAPPSAEEIAAVRAEWAGRDLSPRGVEVVDEIPLVASGGIRTRARVIRHTVHGRAHYGVAIVPEGASPGCCPGVLETKGVSWSYPPLRVPDGLHAPILLDGLLDRLVILAPGLPGEVLQVAGRELRSEGEPNDPFDGATDAALAFLRAAATVTPELRADRMCAFGKSRGGTVSLLVGIRDAGIGCVVDWAGPVDWFEHMGKGGVPLERLVARALADRAPPSAGQGGQLVDWFLRSRDVPLAALRHRMLASSPLHFAASLPSTQAHYGVEDRFVPIVNGEALLDRLVAAGRGWPSAEVVVYEGLGHDLDPLEAARRTREYLVRHLLADR